MIKTSVGSRRNADMSNMTGAFEMMYRGYDVHYLEVPQHRKTAHSIRFFSVLIYLVVLPQTATTMTVVAVLFQAHAAKG